MKFNVANQVEEEKTLKLVVAALASIKHILFLNVIVDFWKKKNFMYEVKIKPLRNFFFKKQFEL